AGDDGAHGRHGEADGLRGKPEAIEAAAAVDAVREDFREIADHGLALAGGEAGREQPDGGARRRDWHGAGAHALLFRRATPSQSLVKVRCASPRTRNPAGVALKWRRARPPRRASGSPMRERMNPLSSSRLSAR